MTLLERLDFSGVRLVYAEFSLSRVAAQAINGGGNKTNTIVTQCLSTTFQNSIRYSDNRLLILCQEEIRTISIVGTMQRIASLQEDGEWLEALALALDHYESTVKSQEDRRRDPAGSRDLSHHPEFFKGRTLIRSEDEGWIAELLLRYLNLVVENAPEPSPDNTPPFHSRRTGAPSVGAGRGALRIDLARSHFQMLAGVCIEFCVITRRLDLMFGQIFRQFQDVGYTDVFLDVLEPYVMNDKLRYIAPEAMARFVDHCRATNDVATVERCLLHMDVTIMDFDSILSLLRQNGMYSALFHVYAHGLDDYVTPLEILMEAIFDAAETRDLSTQRRLDGVAQNSFERYGYKAILYLRHCFTAKTFPQGQEITPESRVHTLRPQMLKFLQLEKYSPSPGVNRNGGGSFGQRAAPFPYMHALLMVDAKAFLDTLKLTFDAPDARFVESNAILSTDSWDIEVEVDSPDVPGHTHHGAEVDKTLCPDRQYFVRILSCIIMPREEENACALLGHSARSRIAKDAFLDFVAEYLLQGVVRVPKSLTFLILSRMSDRVSPSIHMSKSRLAAQDEMLALLRALPPDSYDRKEVLVVVERAHMSRAALLLHKEGVAEAFTVGESGEDARKGHGLWHFARVVDCYLEDEDKMFKREVFDYVKNECMGGVLAAAAPTRGSEESSSLSRNSQEDSVHSLLKSALCEKLPDLVGLDSVLSAKLVAEIFIEDLEDILRSLEEYDRGVAEFKFLHATISGDLTKVDAVAGPVLLSHLSIDHHQTYLRLMAKFHPDMVYYHLKNHDNYRTEECLKLCQEYEIADASAYLLERMGNVSSALQLMLQTLEGRMMSLKRVVRGAGTFDQGVSRRRGKNDSKKKRHEEAQAAKAKREQEIEVVKQILVVSLDICERNSGTSSEHGSQFWFNVLDRLINAKGFLRLAKEMPDHSAAMLGVLSELLRMTMQRMVSKVPLPDLLRKITVDHAGNRLGEFREMIVTMLRTYCSELDICTSATQAMQLDFRQMSQEKRRLKVSNRDGLESFLFF